MTQCITVLIFTKLIKISMKFPSRFKHERSSSNNLSNLSMPYEKLTNSQDNFEEEESVDGYTLPFLKIYFMSIKQKIADSQTLRVIFLQQSALQDTLIKVLG